MDYRDIVNNVEISGLESAIRASKYPMAVDLEKLNGDMTPTVQKLGQSGKGEGHDQFLTGILVSFDLTFTNKAWVELERYRFINFVSSQSTMHRIAKFELDKQYIKYVDPYMIERMHVLVDRYNDFNDPEDYLRVLYSNPAGFMLTARLTTNYRALKTVYSQRKYHRLPEWRALCKWIETLPLFKELILGGE